MELPQIHADTIGRLVLEKFMEVIKGQEAYSRRKVLAGIVMTENMNFVKPKWVRSQRSIAKLIIMPNPSLTRLFQFRRAPSVSAVSIWVWTELS